MVQVGRQRHNTDVFCDGSEQETDCSRILDDRSHRNIQQESAKAVCEDDWPPLHRLQLDLTVPSDDNSDPQWDEGKRAQTQLVGQRIQAELPSHEPFLEDGLARL